jgi:hypothetical protein
MASLVRPTASRALHLRILPRPSNLGESREILRLLSQFGEIEYFKNLKYDALSAPNTTLVIFKEEKAAAACAHKSPIRFRMGKAPAGEQNPPPAPASTTADTSLRSPSGASFDGNQSRAMSTDTLPTPPVRTNQTPFQAPPLPLLESRIYQIESNIARAHFRDQINAGHYHGNFALDTKSVPQKELVKAVPIPGLSCVDWKREDRPWRVVRKEKEREQSGPNRRKTLREIYEKGAAT